MPAVGLALPARRHNRFGKGRKLHRQRRIRVQHERPALEHQFVLPADLIEIDQRQPGLRHAPDRDAQPLVDHAPPIGRAIRHQQDFAAGLGDAFGGLRAPDVLADRHADPHAAEIHRSRHGPDGEHPLLVEHAVIRQIDLEAQPGDPSADPAGRRHCRVCRPRPRACRRSWRDRPARSRAQAPRSPRDRPPGTPASAPGPPAGSRQ